MSDDASAEAFRDQYRREHIGARYNGVLHLCVTTVGALAGIAFALSRVRALDPRELLVVPAAFLFANVVEYLAHRHLMHKPRAILGFLYKRHTLQHHQFFLDGMMSAASTRDWKIVLFPPPVIFFFLGGIGLPAGTALAFATANENLGALFAATAVGYFLLYEFCHLLWHQPDDSLLGRLPFVRSWKAHHHAHHVDASQGFNVTFPITDAIAAAISSRATRRSTT